MSFLVTETGEPIVTEFGEEILVSTPVVTPNFTIQDFDFTVNLLQAILWQYNNALNLVGLVENENNWYAENQTQFWQNWITNVFTLSTANQFGLVIWGIILGLDLYVQQSQNEGPVFGFGGTNGTVNFGNGNFNDPNGSSYMLPIDIQRIALQLRYVQLTTAGCVPEINRALQDIFENYGKVYVQDYQDMEINYVFLFPVTYDLAYLLNNYDILPRPAGVKATWIDGTLSYFGFGAMNLNFNNGNYGA